MASFLVSFQGGHPIRLVYGKPNYEEGGFRLQAYVAAPPPTYKASNTVTVGHAGTVGCLQSLKSMKMLDAEVKELNCGVNELPETFRMSRSDSLRMDIGV